MLTRILATYFLVGISFLNPLAFSGRRNHLLVLNFHGPWYPILCHTGIIYTRVTQIPAIDSEPDMAAFEPSFARFSAIVFHCHHCLPVPTLERPCICWQGCSVLGSSSKQSWICSIYSSQERSMLYLLSE